MAFSAAEESPASVGGYTHRQSASGHLADNSALEAEAAQQAVNYHRVRRTVQEDIRYAAGVSFAVPACHVPSSIGNAHIPTPPHFVAWPQHP